MKFREHCFLLADSMETMIEIPATKAAVTEQINKVLLPYQMQVTDEQVLVDHYTFDERIGWDTYIVFVTGYGVFGFTDEMPKEEPFDINKCVCYPDDKDADKRQCNECPR